MSQAPIFLSEGTRVESFGRQYIATGMTVTQVNTLPPFALESLWRRNGFTSRPPFGSVSGYSVVLMQMEADNHADFEAPQPIPVTCGGVELAPRGSGIDMTGGTFSRFAGEQLELVASIENDDGRRNNIRWEATRGRIITSSWDTVTWELPDTNGIARLDIYIDNVRQSGCRVSVNVQGGVPSPTEPPFEPGTGEVNELIVDVANEILTRVTVEAANQGNRIADAVLEISEEIKGGTGEISRTLQGIREATDEAFLLVLAEQREQAESTEANIGAVPVAVAEQVGPLIVEEGSRLEGIISGLIPAGMPDLLALVPDMALFLSDPLNRILEASGGISQEVLDSVRPR